MALLAVLGLTIAGAQPAFAGQVRPVSAAPDAAPAAAPTPVSADDPSLTSVGNDFWMAFPINAGDPSSAQLTLSISGASAGTGTVSAPAPGQSGAQTFTIVPGQVTQVSVDPSMQVQATDGVENLGIHVTATVPVSVYGTNHIEYTSSGWLGLPSTSLGRSYRALGYTSLIGSPGLSSQLTVIGTVDATTLTITPATAVDGHPAGVSFTQQIDRGQTYQLQATTYHQDISGTTVVASAPVAVMGGNGCADIPEGAYACDQVEQQMMPISTWGTHFATVRYATRTRGDTYRVLANEDGTEVSVNGALVATLGAGEFYEAVLPGNADAAGNEGVQIDASKPVEVAQYGNGTTFDDTTGDPLMLLVPPTGEYLDNYTVSAPDIPTTGGTFSPYASLVVPTADVGQVLLDGTAVSAGSFAVIGTSGYSGAQLTISVGTHHFTGPNPFGLQIYEWGSFDGFGYPGGTALIRISGPAESPASPTTATAIPGNHSATITWNAPADDGGSAVTSYVVQTYADGALVDGKTCTLASPFTPPLQCTVDGLTNGTEYTFTVTASNAIGTGPASAASVVVVPDDSTPTAPGAPTAAVAAAGDAQVAVSWTAPVDNGGADITSYQVITYVNGDVVPGKSCTLSSPFTPPLTCTVTGLTNGTSYDFAVTATNSAGTSVPSDATKAVVPTPAPTAPGAPTAVAAVAGNQEVSVSWSAPLDDGDSDITSYTAQAYVDGTPVAGKTCTLGAPLTPPLTCTISGLNNGTSYTVAVTATNDIGTGAASDPSTSVTPTPPPAAPGAPTSVGATPGNQRATVSWDAPDSNGGALITSYTVQAYSDGDPVSGATCVVTAPFTPPLRCTVTDLVNGTAYTFKVRATNSVGAGANSDPSDPTTPTSAATQPGSPESVSVAAGDGAVEISWAAPESDGGATITGYTVQARRNGVVVPGRTCTITGPFTTPLKCTISGLTNGVAYTFDVVATNSVGGGEPSLPSDPITPIPAPTAPEVPTGVVATAIDGGATISWVAPANNGGAPVQSFHVQAYVNGVAVTGASCATAVKVTAPKAALTCTIKGLHNGTAVTFKVTATNAIGTSAASAPSAPVTPTAGTHAVPPVLPIPIANGMFGVEYTGTVHATAGTLPIHYIRIAPGSPPGLVLNRRTGAITGKPVKSGRFTLTVEATNIAGSATRTWTIDIAPAIPSSPRYARSTAVHGGAWITFIQPASSGSAPIRGYQVSIDVGRTWRPLAVKHTAEYRGLLTGLVSGHTYRVYLRAISAAGGGVSTSFPGDTATLTVSWSKMPAGRTRDRPAFSLLSLTAMTPGPAGIGSQRNATAVGWSGSGRSDWPDR